MKLFFSPGACSKATWITLEWTGAPYEVHQVKIHGDKSPELLAHNEMGAVPTLEHNGWWLTQNAAILNYVIDSYPQANIGGDRSPKARAEINRWVGMINSDIHPLYKAYFGGSAYLEDEATIEKTKQNAATLLQQRFAIVDAHLEGREWLSADAHTPADAYLFVVVSWAHMLKIDLSGLKNLEAHYARMNADPAVQRVLAREAEARRG